jgi:hypothetical protein
MSINEVKRFYIDGYENGTYKWDCPVCGNHNEYDHYVSYPDAGVPIEIFGCCDHEDTEFEDEVYFEEPIAYLTINVSLEWEAVEYE